MQQTTDIDLMPFILEAFSTTTTVYKYIDKIYDTNPKHYNHIANKSIYSKHPFATHGTVLEDEYFKKALGILSNIDDDAYIQLIKKGWPFVYTYCKNKNTIFFADLSDSALRCLGKNTTTNTIVSYCIIALQLSIILDITIDQSDPRNEYYLESLHQRSNVYRNFHLTLKKEKIFIKMISKNFMPFYEKSILLLMLFIMSLLSETSLTAYCQKQDYPLPVSSKTKIFLSLTTKIF